MYSLHAVGTAFFTRLYFKKNEFSDYNHSLTFPNSLKKGIIVVQTMERSQNFEEY